jgi:hypothetical protein
MTLDMDFQPEDEGSPDNHPPKTIVRKSANVRFRWRRTNLS